MTLPCVCDVYSWVQGSRWLCHVFVMSIPGYKGEDDFAMCLWCLFLGTRVKMTLPCVCDVCSWLQGWRWLYHVFVMSVPGYKGEDDFAMCLWCLLLATRVKMTLPCVFVRPSTEWRCWRSLSTSSSCSWRRDRVTPPFLTGSSTGRLWHWMMWVTGGEASPSWLHVNQKTKGKKTFNSFKAWRRA